MKLRTGDSVLIIAGKDRGKSGTVLRVLKNKGRLVVEAMGGTIQQFQAQAVQIPALALLDQKRYGDLFNLLLPNTPLDYKAACVRIVSDMVVEAERLSEKAAKDGTASKPDDETDGA